MKNIMVTERWVGYGKVIIDYLFNTQKITQITDHAILETSVFWKGIGATFEFEPTEKRYGGEYFLKKKILSRGE